MSLNPRTEGEWKARAKEANLDPENILVAERSYHSASKLTLEEFLYFRVIWSQKSVDDIDYNDLVSRQVVEMVEETNFTDCTAGIGTRDPHKDLQSAVGRENIFTMPQYYMHLIQKGVVGTPIDNASPKIWKTRLRRNRDPEKPYNEEEASNRASRLPLRQSGNISPKMAEKQPARTPPNQVTSGANSLAMTPGDPEFAPRTEYEVTVNMALVTFLSAIRLRCRHLELGHWLADQKPMFLSDMLGKTLLEARVDGYLKKERETGPFGILEVKPYVRMHNMCETQWQEAGQMVAWISMTPGKDANGVFNIPGDSIKTRRRFMFSQDRDEIYVTIATYDGEYETFLAKSRSDMTPKASTVIDDTLGTADNIQPQVAKYGSFTRYRRSQKNKSPTRSGPGVASLIKPINAMSLEESDDNDSSDSDKQTVRKIAFPLLSRGGKKGETSLDKGDDGTGSLKNFGKIRHIEKVKGFLKMTSFGPYKIDVPEHMTVFCKIAACLTKAVLDRIDHEEGKEIIFN